MHPRLAQTILKKYHSNEEINAHTDNWLLLALHYGDGEYIRQAELAVKTRTADTYHPYVIPTSTAHILTKFYYDIKELAEEGIDITYTVISISKNTNSFGLRQALLLEPRGNGKSILINHLSKLKQGDDVILSGGRLQTDHECAADTKRASERQAPILIKQAKENAGNLTP